MLYMINQSPNQSIVRELAAFIPQDYRHALTKKKNLPSQTVGTALFADISGFTHITRSFYLLFGRQKGAEAVLSQINPIYEEIITHLHRYGGSVVNFMGDGVLCWFDEAQGSSCDRAIVTALAIQKAMARFASISLPNGEELPLNIKIAIASGPAYRVLVGNPDIRVLKSMAGETIHRVALLGSLTHSSEISICVECINRFGQELNVVPGRNKHFVILREFEGEVPPIPWSQNGLDHLSPEDLRPWLLPSLFNHVRQGGTIVGDLRPVTPMMIRFTEPDFDNDPDASEKLNAYVSWVQRVVHSFGGTLIQFSIGDKGANLYAPFGAPIAHENDRERATLAALALHNPPTEVAPPGGIQIGLSRGNVWTGACGAAARFTYGVMGDDVNLAARLMITAQPGQTIVSEKMMADSRFNYRELGLFSYKGFPHEVKTFELLNQKGRSETGFTTKLIERSYELKRLKDALEPIFTGKFAGVITVWGDAGIGKSHLIHELSGSLESQVVWLEGAFESVRQASLAPFKQMVRSYFDQSIERSHSENLYRFDQILTRLIESLPLNGESVDTLQRELFRSKSMLAAMVGLHWKGSLYDQLSPNLRFDNQLFAFKNFVRVLGLIQPVVIHLGDTHWLDEDSEKMLQALTRNACNLPLALIFDSRYERLRYPAILDFADEVPQTTIDLKELSRQGVSALSAQILSGEVPSSLVDYLSEKTSGNPLFVQQLLLALREQQSESCGERVAGAEPEFANLSVIPESLNTVLVSRLDTLGEVVKDVIQTAAVLGREFDEKLLARMLKKSARDIRHHIRAAEDAQIWLAGANRRYLFRHVLMRDAAYGMQINPRLQALHRLAAEAIIEEHKDDLNSRAALLAYHFDLAGDHPNALHWYQSAAERLADTYANQEAVRAYSRALELAEPEDYETRFALLKGRAQIHMIIGKRTEQKEDIDNLLGLTNHLRSGIYRSKAYLEAGQYYARVSNPKEAIKALQQALNALEAEAEEELTLKIKIYSTWAQTAWQSGDFETAKEKFAFVHPLSTTEPLEEAAVLSGLSVVYGISGEIDESIAYGERALKLLRESKDLMREAVTLNSLGIQARRKGEYSKAATYYTSSKELMYEIGFRFGMTVIHNNLAAIHMETGQYARAKHESLQSIELSKELGLLRSACWGMVYLAATLLRLEALDEGLQVVQDVIQKVDDCGDPDLEGYATLYLGLILAEKQAWPEATAALRRSVEIRHQLKQSNMATEPMAALIEIALARGDLDTARDEAGFILGRLEEDPHLAGPSEPFLVHFNLYLYLKAQNDYRAHAILKRASRMLLERSQKISEPSMRRSYLENVAVHKAIMERSRLLG
ncbi:MAG: AAA family ATPase [Chloroflexota bacterium]